jgi:uncharacterized protein YoaH (UPF0181 family)
MNDLIRTIQEMASKQVLETVDKEIFQEITKLNSVSEETELDEAVKELNKRDFETLKPGLDAIKSLLKKIYEQENWETSFKTVEKLLGNSYFDLGQVYSLSGKKHRLADSYSPEHAILAKAYLEGRLPEEYVTPEIKEAAEVLAEATSPKFNKEKETITFVNDAEARAAEKAFKAKKIAVKLSGKKASFINTAEYKQAVSIINDAAADLKKKIFGEDISEAKLYTKLDGWKKALPADAVVVTLDHPDSGEVIHVAFPAGTKNPKATMKLSKNEIGRFVGTLGAITEETDDDWTEYDEEVFEEDNRQIDALVAQGLSEDEAIDIVLGQIEVEDDIDEESEELDEKRMSSQAKRKAAIYRKKNKIKLKKYRKKRAKRLKSGAIRVKASKSRQIKRARKKPGITSSVDHGDTTALTEEVIVEDFASAMAKIGKFATNVKIASKNLVRGKVLLPDDIEDLQDTAIKIARMTVDINSNGGAFTSKHNKIFSEVMTTLKRLSKAPVRADKQDYVESAQPEVDILLEAIDDGIINLANAIISEAKGFDVEKEIAGFEKVMSMKKFKTKRSGNIVTITSGEAKGISYEFSPEKIEGKTAKGKVWTSATAKATGSGQGEDMAKELAYTYK